uniref:SAP domain containing ribonucleoprotein n=1 Tax=Xenopus tropicalis TaxID=8364 RepID=A0A6I8RJ76_XENTR
MTEMIIYHRITGKHCQQFWNHLAELKQECLARGLEVKGNKSDLISRLQAYIEEHAEEEANEEDVLGEETEEEEQKSSVAAVKEEEPDDKPADTNAEKKLVKISSSASETDKLQKRAERFNVPASVDSKKAARAIRLGIIWFIFKLTELYFHINLQWFIFSGEISDAKSPVSMDKLKERAQRFGLSVSPVSKKSEDDEKLKKRKERFGIVTSSASVTDDTEVRLHSSLG